MISSPRSRPARFLARAAFLFALIHLVPLSGLLGGCGGEQEKTDSPSYSSPGPSLSRVPLRGNVLSNPGFEEGRRSWFSPETASWVGFEVTEERGHGGERAAVLLLGAGELTPRTQVWGVSQYINPEEFPRKLSGWYLVDRWAKGAPHQYLQAVIMVWGGYPERDFQNYQVRYLLGGVEEQPYFMANVRYVFLGRGDPVEGEWTYFECNPAEDFSRLWKLVPSEYDKLQVFFEARFDDRTDALAPTSGDVYYDDLYLGE